MQLTKGVTLPRIFAVVTAATGLIGASCPCILKKGWSCYAFLFFHILSGQGQNVRAVKWSVAEIQPVKQSRTFLRCSQVQT